MNTLEIGTILSKESFENALSVLGIKEDEKTDLSKIAISKFLKGTITEEKTHAKNVVLINHIHNLGLTYVPPTQIRNQCPTCSGNGFNVIFVSSEEVKCTTCNGTGWKISGCTKCSGTGRIGETPCFICHGRGTYIYKKTDKYPGKKCLDCMGIGKVKKLVQSDSKIQEVSACKKCNETGMFTEVRTQLINSDMAEKLNNLKLSINNTVVTEQNPITVAAPVEKKKRTRKTVKTEETIAA